MLSRNNKTKLNIFENFNIDQNLPKHKKEKGDGTMSYINGAGFGVIRTDDGRNLIEGGNWNDPQDSSWGQSEDGGSRPNIFRRFLNYVASKIRKRKKVISIRDFFLRFAGSYEELSQIGEIADHYEAAINQAKELNQVALKEKLASQLEVARSESHLIAMNLTKYVTEENVIDLYNQTDEDECLKLTWMKNYVRIIPNEVIAVKKSIDARKIFDNYVILHFDPFNNSTNLTKKEVEIEKDPILFGVIEGSRKLYYVGDWVDEVCDLTLEEMFNRLGGEALEINNESLKTYLNSVDGDGKK